MKAQLPPSPLLARELVDFLQRLEINAVPAAVSDIAKSCLLDALGCALFGSKQPGAHVMAAEAAADGAAGRRRATAPRHVPRATAGTTGVPFLSGRMD